MARRPRPAPDRTPVDLMTLPAAQALTVIADWLDDCDTHLWLRRPGGLPTAPFDFMAAFAVVQSAADRAAGSTDPMGGEGLAPSAVSDKAPDMTPTKPPLAAWVLFLVLLPLLIVIFAVLWLYGAYGRAFPASDAWRLWFAWRPVVLGDGSVAWLRLIERRELGNGFSAYRERGQ